MLKATYSPDGERIVTASMDNTAKIWDSKTMQEIVSLIGHKGEIVTATYSPNGQQIVTASYDGTAKVWDAETGLELVTLTGHDGRVTSFSNLQSQ